MNPTVIRRFSELADKADRILEAKTLDFVSHDGGKRFYDIDAAEFRGWAASVLNLLQRIFGEDSMHFRHFTKQEERVNDNEGEFRAALAIFHAAREDYEGGYLFNMQSLVKAEVFDEVLEQANALLGSGYKDPACVVVGVALETTLKGLCSREGIPHAKLDKMNADLAKAGKYNKGMQKQVTAWADRRNCAAHGEWQAYSKADVQDMMAGVTRLIAELL